MTSTQIHGLLSALLALLMIGLAFFYAPAKTVAVGSPACVCQMDPKKPLYCPTVVCVDTTNGFSTVGHCVTPGICRGETTSGQNGGMGDLKSALDAIKGILDAMKGGGGGGSGGGSQSGTTNPTLGGCTTYYNVTTPSSDPCAVYVPPVSDSLGSTTGSSAASDLISSLLNGSYGSSNVNTGNTTGTANTQATSTTTTQTAAAQATSSAANPVVVQALVPGVSGDIQYSSDSVTVLVNNVDTSAGTQVAGFYGTAANGQPTGVISSMCQSRPWSNNFLSFIIPASFFDSLCQLRGYQVGTPKVVAPATHTTQTATVTKTTATVTPSAPVPVATSTGPYVEPQADIWAVPASVPLGARTTVFWTAKGVTECTETSPDGSFSQNSLSGGAATVPLSGATTYTISCLTPAGDHITNYVTVNLSAN